MTTQAKLRQAVATSERTVYCDLCKKFYPTKITADAWRAGIRKSGGGYPAVRHVVCLSRLSLERQRAFDEGKQNPTGDDDDASDEGECKQCPCEPEATERQPAASAAGSCQRPTDRAGDVHPVGGESPAVPTARRRSNPEERPYGFSMKLRMRHGTISDFHCVASTEKTARRLALRKRMVAEIVDDQLLAFTREQYARVYGTRKGRD